MIFADMIMRGGAIAIGLLCAAALMSRRETRQVGRPVLALALAKTCYLIVSAPVLPDIPAEVMSVLVGGAVLMPLAFSWLVVDIFLDAPADRAPWLIIAGLGVILSLASLIWPQLATARGVLLLGLVLSFLWIGLTTARSDLVEHRRRFRSGFLVAMALLGVAVASVELVWQTGNLPPFIYPLQAAAFLALTFSFALWVLSPTPDLCCQADVPLDAPSETRRATAVEMAIADTLNEAMGAGIWRREGLTIAALASELGVAEHRLRKVINQRLGFRNFPTFINSYRIDAAKNTLADPEQAQKSILEIAYASGFASLGPFNKAFRDQAGESPSEYRRRAFDSFKSLSGSEKTASVSKSKRPRPV